ncbi:MAG: phosphoglucomutase/phosphomannomutase family protein [Clostridia bacterium]|nr:phosphoglucomutase/phosphomannomutase family protein [Clostridia bacterium]
MAIKFGTGGWRAIIGDEFIKENICLLAQAVAEDMEPGKDAVVIGYDRRFLSDTAAIWASEVFAGNGIKVWFVDRIAPTPLVMFGVKDLETKYGMAITASHNPAAYNGIKLFTAGGRDASAETTVKFEAILEKGVTVKSMPFEEGQEKGLIETADIYNRYIDSIIDMIDMKAIRKKQLKILLDPMFGVSRTSLQTVLMTARCDVDIINDRHDALFGGKLPAPTENTLSDLRDRVVHEHYDLGIATDGDADRIGIIDRDGNYIKPNEILALLYYYLMKYKGQRGAVVRNIATTHLLDRIAEDFGQQCLEVPVGFKHISSGMEETDAIIGGESSGGLTIRGHIRGKDGIFASALLVEMLSTTGKSIAELLEEIYARYGVCKMTEFDTKFSQAKKDEIHDLLFVQKKVPTFPIGIEKISYADGMKIYFENGGWIIARFSGTEPLIRIFCEMESVEKAEAITQILRTFVGL